jgi:integrase
VLYLTQQKTKKDLEIPIHPRLDLILGARPNDDRPLLPRLDGGHYDSGTIRDVLQAFAAARGHKIVPHGLRKNAVNALLECGCTAAETAAISGQSLSLVEHYARRRNTGKLAHSAMQKLTGPKRESENL